MRAANVRRWQWMLIGLALGGAAGAARGLLGADAMAFPESFNDQALFERAIRREFHGRRQFDELVVYPVRLPADGPRASSGPAADARLVHVVTGRFYDGTPRVRDGRVEAVWEPRCFVAPTPYRPLGPDGRPAAGGSDGDATVLSYLRGQGDVAVQYAWWCDPRWGGLAGAAGGFVLIGLVWPTVVNLLVFGRLTRPTDVEPEPEPRRAPARRGGVPTNAAAGASGADDALAAVAAQADRLLAELSARGDWQDAAPAPTTGAMKPAAAPARAPFPAPALAASAGTDTPASPTDDQPAKEFGAAADDYYPTERHAPRPPPQSE